MRKIFQQRGKTSKFLGVIVIASLLISCSNYSSNLISLADTNSCTIDLYELRCLDQQKELLNKESIEIIKKITQRLECDQPLKAKDIHQLFENLSNHLTIDQIFEKAFNIKGDNYCRQLGWDRLMKSADFYSNVFQPYKGIRRIINRGDEAYHVPPNYLAHTQHFLWNNLNRHKAIHSKLNLNKTNKSGFDFLLTQQTDKLFETIYQTSGRCSEVFSRLVAAIHTGRSSEKNINQLLPSLKKWDIICQKSPQCLTDHLIPGYFGHVGIYLGDSTFVESIQDGVTLSTAQRFLEGSSFIVLRPIQISNQQDAHMNHLVKSQIGKQYDFNYNIESPDQLVCTELIFLVFDRVNWRTEKAVGRTIICPDFLVQTALQSSDIRIPVLLEHDKLVENPTPQYVTNLLQRD